MINSQPVYKTAMFNDYDAYTSEIEHADMRLTLPRLEGSSWILNRIIQPDSIQIQSGHEESGSISDGVSVDYGYTLFIPLYGDTCKINGIHLPCGSTFIAPPKTEFFLSDITPNDWISVLIPVNMMTFLQSIDFECPTGQKAESLGYSYHLVELLNRFIFNVSYQPEILNYPPALEAFNKSLIAMVEMLVRNKLQQPIKQRGRPFLADPRIIRVAVEYIEDRLDPTLTMKDIMRVTGLSEKTLRNSFVRFLGISPQRYIQLRKLHLAKNMIINGMSHNLNISEIAATVGYWDAGRFSARYKRLFGELPSITLARTREGK
ncbi:MAG: helix-turn-helix domain-containing protein [Sedimenticola sp.]